MYTRTQKGELIEYENSFKQRKQMFDHPYSIPHIYYISMSIYIRNYMYTVYTSQQQCISSFKTTYKIKDGWHFNCVI